jgi:uncharacterized protein YecE (DUF72 family)
MKNKGKIYIGTSGWHYDHWRGPFYPKNLSADEFLSHYCKHFNTVEINNSFYHLPRKTTFLDWGNAAPQDFMFAIKASRYITHMKKLKEPKEALEKFLDHAEALGDKQGPVLFQLPPRWRANPNRLRDFFALLPKSVTSVFEFRDTSWFQDEIYQILKENDAAFCIYYMQEKASPLVVTADFVYIRFHGPDGVYAGKYTKKALKDWADDISDWSDEGKEIYCYFNNDQHGYAVENAIELKALLDA